MTTSRLEHVIARNVGELREQHGATQSELAAKMRANGFTWQTNRAAQIETLRRPVSLLEVVGLSYVFLVPVSRLLEGDDVIEMPDGSTMPLSKVRDALAGVSRVEVRDATPMESARHQASVDDLRKLAKRLSISPSFLEAVAYRCFGQSLIAERESRLGDVAGMSIRSAQTKRGHVTRQLMAELEAWISAPGNRQALTQEIGAARARIEEATRTTDVKSTTARRRVKDDGATRP